MKKHPLPEEKTTAHGHSLEAKYKDMRVSSRLHGTVYCIILYITRTIQLQDLKFTHKSWL